jgi:hypothetical protein
MITAGWHGDARAGSGNEQSERRITCCGQLLRIVGLQRRIDDGRTSGRLPLAEGRDYQSRLDSIRSDYLQMTEGGRSTTYEQRADISRRLDSLEIDLNRFR